jgi:hypothetical protein
MWAEGRRGCTLYSQQEQEQERLYNQQLSQDTEQERHWSEQGILYREQLGKN